MRGRLLHAWDAARSSLWFVPTLMACAAVMLALLLLWIDARLPAEWSSDVSWIHSRTRAGARDVLSTIASSMMTVAGLAFSITVVALQLASTQFGPRLLRNFMADRSNQAVLGTFIATYLYCILVLRTIGGAAGDDGARFSEVHGRHVGWEHVEDLGVGPVGLGCSAESIAASTRCTRVCMFTRAIPSSAAAAVIVIWPLITARTTSMRRCSSGGTSGCG